MKVEKKHATNKLPQRIKEQLRLLKTKANQTESNWEDQRAVLAAPGWFGPRLQLAENTAVAFSITNEHKTKSDPLS